MRKNRIAFNEHRFKPWDFPKDSKVVQFFAIESDRLLELLELYPKAEEIFKDYCIKQTEFLRQTRLKKKHLYPHGRNDFDFTLQGTKKRPVFLNSSI